MLTYTRGNLLEADVEALVNTVNTVGVMGKGVALMFRESFPENFRAYAEACKRGDVNVGRMFVTERHALSGPRWIINFPTKQHWRTRTQIEWVEVGLVDLVRVIREKGIRSIALPPLGCGNGGLHWNDVRPRIEAVLGELEDIDVRVFEPTRQYRNVQKRQGVEKLTPARALVAEAVRRYSLKGLDCSVLEVQKLAWFLETSLHDLGLANPDPLDLRFTAHRYGPYAHRLMHLLNGLDGSYLHCEKRLADVSPLDLIEFNPDKRHHVVTYLGSREARPYMPALERAEELIEGFQSPYGLELLATIDWLIRREDCAATVAGIRSGLEKWPGGRDAGRRKLSLFDDRVIGLALDRLREQAPRALAADA
jgi:O-acetyl-ADP-ribose deacetylase (regulator of RNase III)